jgi:hypothetical protein
MVKSRRRSKDQLSPHQQGVWRGYGPTSQPTNQKTMGRVKRRRETSFVAWLRHSGLRNALLEMVNGALNGNGDVLIQTRRFLGGRGWLSELVAVAAGGRLSHRTGCPSRKGFCVPLAACRPVSVPALGLTSVSTSTDWASSHRPCWSFWDEAYLDGVLYHGILLPCPGRRRYRDRRSITIILWYELTATIGNLTTWNFICCVLKLKAATSLVQTLINYRHKSTVTKANCTNKLHRTVSKCSVRCVKYSAHRKTY